jgi:hypothetical protein
MLRGKKIEEKKAMEKKKKKIEKTNLDEQQEKQDI